MKIIKKTDTNAWAHSVTCDKCDSELEVEKNDLYFKHYPGDCRGESAYDKFYCYCPVCHDQINILNEKIPKAVQVEVKQKKNTTSSGTDFRDGPFEDFYNK